MAAIGRYLHQQGMDTTTPAGKALFQMMGVFAEFERAMIQGRVRAGLERARAQGKQLGRPTVSVDVEARIADLVSRAWEKIKIARTLGIGVSTVQRVVGQPTERPGYSKTTIASRSRA